MVLNRGRWIGVLALWVAGCSDADGSAGASGNTSTDGGESTGASSTSESETGSSEPDPPPGACSNGLIEPYEECDGAAGCSDDCTAPGAHLWTAEYAAPAGSAEALAVAVDPDDNVIVGGWSHTTPHTKVPWLRKYGPGGEEHWTVTVDDVIDNFVGIATDSGGTIYAATVFEVSAYDPDGNALWQWEAPMGVNMRAIAAAADGRVLAAGQKADDPAQVLPEDANVWVARLQPTGELTSSWEHGSAERWEQATSIALDADANVILAGWSAIVQLPDEFEDSRLLVSKVVADDSLAWEQIGYGPDGAEAFGRDLAIDLDGNVVVVGDAGGGGFLRKYDPAGNLLVDQFVGAAGDVFQYATGIAVRANAQLVVVGHGTQVYGPQDGLEDYVDYSTLWARGFDGQGGVVWTWANVQWDRSNRASAIASATQGVAIVGLTTPIHAGNFGAWTCLYAP